MTCFSFRPSIQRIGRIDRLVHRSVIHDEPMLFSASVAFAGAAGGPLTRMLLESIGDELEQAQRYCSTTGQFLVIDTRSHMLMQGFRPAIGGWHCDAYPRPAFATQPDLAAGKPDNFHIVAFVSDQECGVSRTEFVTSAIDVPAVDPERVWSSVHKSVESQPRNTMFQEEGEVLRFSQETLHRASLAHAQGWRWWARISVYYAAPNNMLRKQVQVYGSEDQSW